MRPPFALPACYNTDRQVRSTMPRPTKQSPERGGARLRLLEAARDTIRAKGFAATSVDEICAAAGVTKGAFFHHFASKEALGIAAAGFWGESTGALFASAPYHAPSDPLERVLAYLDFRRMLIGGEIWEWTCLVGTMAEEVHATHPAIAEACGAAIFEHAATLEADIALAMAQRGITEPSAASLARHTQAVLQGAFILAKAGGGQEAGREALDHLKRYVELLFREGTR